MKQYIAILASATVLAACSSTPESSSNVSSASGSMTQPSTPPASRQSSASAPAGSQAARGSDLSGSAVPQKNSVYFDYDSSQVKEDSASLLSAHARYLSQHAAHRVRVEGNTDERGSREYNLALGQQRADAVKQRLTLLGVPGPRIETVSFGEEKPRSENMNESAYAENRRADIVSAAR